MRPPKLVSLALALTYGATALPIVTLPWFGQVSLEGLAGCLGYVSGLTEERTIYQVLKDDTQYSRLVKAIDLSESVVDLLSDPSKSFTFFAVPDSNLRHHHKPHHGDHRHNQSLVPFSGDSPIDVGHDLADLVQQAEELEEEPDSRDKDRRKEALARIVQKIVAYHILPGSREAADLVQNSTYATNLTLNDGSMDWEPLRLSVLNTPFPPRLRINRFVEVTRRDIKAQNGVIHQISRPLLPPPSIFQETFLVPDAFSFFTSAIQRVDLTGAVDRWKTKDHGQEVGFSGATATTAFVPTSVAFKRLPRRLKLYLFSPFGRKALKKLLEYHIVPDTVLYTDYFHNSSSDIAKLSRSLHDVSETQFSVQIPALFESDLKDLVSPKDTPSLNTVPRPELVYEHIVTLPTLLRDHYLRIHVARYKSGLPIRGFSRYFTVLKVNGHHVGLFDIPARNGVLHVLPTILKPHRKHDHHGGDGEAEEDEVAWEDWEEWLPQWAMED